MAADAAYARWLCDPAGKQPLNAGLGPNGGAGQEGLRESGTHGLDPALELELELELLGPAAAPAGAAFAPAAAAAHGGGLGRLRRCR